MRISVGSLNPAKIKAVELAAKEIFDSDIEIIPIEVKEAPKQPLSDEEMIKGAILRAKRAFESVKSDYSIGLEGGVVRNNYGVFVKGWVAVFDGKALGLASTVAVPLPDYVWELLVSGKYPELEDIMINISGIKDIARSIGAIGFITNGFYDRIRAFRDAIFCAFGRFFKKNIFEGTKL